ASWREGSLTPREILLLLRRVFSCDPNHDSPARAAPSSSAARSSRATKLFTANKLRNPVTRHGMGVARHSLAYELVSASKRRGGQSRLNHYSGVAVRSALTRHRFDCHCASPGSYKRHIQKPMNCFPQGASISPLLRCQQAPRDERVHFAATHFNCYTAQSEATPLAVTSHALSAGTDCCLGSGFVH